MADHHRKYTHAYVYYIETRERDIVSLDCVKNFQLESYSQNKKYKILWNSKEYEGTVVFLGESFDAVQEHADKERPRIPTVSLLVSNSSESESDVKQLNKKAVHSTSEKMQLLSTKLNNLTERNKKRKPVDLGQKNLDGKNETPTPKISRKTNEFKENENSEMQTPRRNADEDIAKKNDTAHQSSTNRNVVADLELKNLDKKTTPKSSKKASEFNKENEVSENRTPRRNGDEKLTHKNDTPQSSASRNVVADLEQINLDKKTEAVTTSKSSKKANAFNMDDEISENRTSRRNDDKKIAHKNDTPQNSASRNDCCINTKKKYLQLSQQHKNLIEKNEELELMLKDSQILNVELQRKVIKGMGTVQETLERLINRPISANNLAHDEKLDYPPVAFKRLSDNQVHIGRDIWISSQVYDTILISSRSTSLFVKNMAVAVFGIDLLKTSTVKGKVSNRLRNKDAIPRPALDHTKVLAIEDIFRHWLEDKQKLPSTEINYLASLVPTYIGKQISQLNATPKPKPNVNYRKSQILQNDEEAIDFDSSVNTTSENYLNDSSIYSDNEADNDFNKSTVDESDDDDDYESD